MITVAQAQAQLGRVEGCMPTELVLLQDALGRVAGKDIISGMAIPLADNSAMDGFAVREADLSESSTLPISQRIPAGSQPERLLAHTAARIFTGGMLPPGADTVVIQENCEFDASQVTIKQTVVRGDNIRPCGQDIANGAKVVSKGQRLNAVDLSLLASVGVVEVSVFAPLRVAILSSGDELVEPGKPLKPGQIYNSNRPLLLALCQQFGVDVVDCGIVEDTLQASKAALQDAASKADLIITTGGVSVGEEDHMKPAVEALGSLDLWKVQMKPGKPVAYGRVGDTPMIGLPGNPVSSFVVFQLLAAPLMRALQGQRQCRPEYFGVISDFDKPLTRREEYVRVKLVRDDKGQLRAEKFPNLSSGVMSSLSWADGLVRHQADHSISSGQMLDFFPLREAML